MAFAFKKSVFDGANVEFDDPTIDINPKAFKATRVVDPNQHFEGQCDDNGSDGYDHGQYNSAPNYSGDADENAESDITFPGRRGTKAFFSPGGSIQGKMAAENYYKHVRPLQGSLTTLGASKSINSRYADVVRSHIQKLG